MKRKRSHQPTVLVIGGAVAGLAAAEALHESAEVTLVERQSYDSKRVNCGEAINESTLVPLSKTPENGFVNRVDGFDLEIYPGTDREPGTDPLTSVGLECESGYICDRNVVERQWARRLESEGVTVEEGRSISPPEYRELTDKYDYVFDATGQPSLTMKTLDRVDSYTGDMVALNADVAGEFGEYRCRPRIFFEGYVGYAWSFPKSDSRANVGIGWAGDQRPADYFKAFEAACDRIGLPAPDRSDTNIYTIPRGPSLDPEDAYLTDHDILLIGDAAGIANRYQGEGICQAIRSARIAGETITNGRPERYPERLYGLMKSEFRLAHLMRGAWVEHEDPELLARVADSLAGLTIDDITRNPRRVFGRVARNPGVATRLVADRGMVGRFIDAYTNRWEYTNHSPVESSSTAD
jgi:digeranylgeranylglycerophospholipid reductase